MTMVRPQGLTPLGDIIKRVPKSFPSRTKAGDLGRRLRSYILFTKSLDLFIITQKFRPGYKYLHFDPDLQTRSRKGLTTALDSATVLI